MGGLIINRDDRTREEKLADEQNTYELNAYWCLTEDQSTAVPEGHPDARFVLGGPGRRIPMADALKYGLVTENAVIDKPDHEDKPAKKSKKAKEETK